MEKIEHEIKIKGSKENVYKAINSLEGLTSWFSAKGEQDGKIWKLKPNDSLDYHFRVIKDVPDKEIVWDVHEGPSKSRESNMIFKISDVDNGRVLVEFEHDSWPDKEGHFRKCNTYWALALGQLKKYVEKGIVDPAF